MKRIITFIVCMVVLTVTVSAVTTAKCLLQHKGSCKIYDPDAIETAIKNAVDGDTIFLTEGTFPKFTISKKITVRGAGQGTKINGDVNISITGTPTLTQTVLEGVDLGSNNLVLASAMNGVKIKQCKMYRLYTNANNNNVIIDRCRIDSEMIFSSYIKGMTILNSWVQIGYTSSSSDPGVNFINCYVYAYYVNKCAGTFINCIVRGYDRSSSSYSYYYNCNFANSLLCGSYRNVDGGSCTVQNCYQHTQTTFDVNTLENLGFLGNDGTVVGEYGGVNPYTLELAVPKVTENTIALDVEKKILNVSLKVSAN